jgi:hypothetical protein
MFGCFRLLVIHQLGEHATRPIAHFWLWPLCLTFVSLTLASTETSLSGRPALLLRLAWNSQGASALARPDRFAGSQHAARNPCSTLAERPEKRHSSTSTRRFQVKGNFGALPLDIPRDRQGSLATPIVGKHQVRWTGFDDKIISPYARGLTAPEIQSHREEI